MVTLLAYEWRVFSRVHECCRDKKTTDSVREFIFLRVVIVNRNDVYTVLLATKDFFLQNGICLRTTLRQYLNAIKSFFNQLIEA